MRDKSSINKRNNAKGAIIATSHHTYSGPLPSPEDFAAYGHTVPDAPERILIMAEKQSEHRKSIEKKVLKFAIIKSIVGQIIGFVLALVFLAAAIWLAREGHEKLSITIIVALSSLIAIFVLKKSPKNKNE